MVTSWCILLDESENIIWSQNQPEDIPAHYTINDIAKLTRWFLNDYPVYVRAEDYGLLVFGIPKNAVGKYDIAYSMNWFDTLPQRIAAILLVNLFLALILASVIGIRLYKKLKQLTTGINDLKDEKPINLPEKGIFKDLSRNLNETSRTIERKNNALSIRDSARLNWIAGISHDIRTPLAIIMGQSEAIGNSCEKSEQNAKKANAITTQCIRIKKLIEDLNLISSLEYDMQPSKKQPVRICPLLRSIVTDICNSGMSEKYEMGIETINENAVVSGDSTLIERAVFNLIDNSINHNKNGCNIFIKEYTKNMKVYIEISDNGTGVDESIIKKIQEMPKSAHGLGLPMAYKIISVHSGKFYVKNNNGFSVTIELPQTE